MSLTANDLNEIRTIINEAMNPLQNELRALRNDIKEIYSMLSSLEAQVIPDKQFQKLTIEEKLLKLNTELLSAAKQAGISLPR